MGTRSLTHIRGDKGVLVTIYRQMDGYPSGMGADLKAIVGNVKLTNGYNGTQKLPKYANGMSCLAAYVVGKLKNAGNYNSKTGKRVPGFSIGGIYLYPAGSSDCDEEYVYTIYQVADRVGLKVEKAGWTESHKVIGTRYVEHPPVTLYDGLAADFDPEACRKSDEAA